MLVFCKIGIMRYEISINKIKPLKQPTLENDLIVLRLLDFIVKGQEYKVCKVVNEIHLEGGE